MNVRISFVTMLLAGIALAGCRRDPYLDIYLDAVNAEKRYLEDQVYELKFEYEAKLQELETLRQENRSLRGGAGEPGEDTPRIEIPGTAEPSGSGSPKIDFGSESNPQSNPSDPPSEILPAIPPTKLPDSKNDKDSHYVPPVDQRVTHIVLNPYLSQGHNFDGKPGDDGVSLVIQPRNAEDRFVPVAGTVSVVVLDPLAEGESARVARWDLDAEEVQHRMRTATQREAGIHLKMQWPGGRPKHSKLQVFVRYVSDDQRKFETDGELFIALPGQFSNRWTPRPADHLFSQPPASTSGSSMSYGERGSFDSTAKTTTAKTSSLQQAMLPATKLVPARPINGGISTGFRDQLEESFPAGRFRQRRRPSWKPFR